MIRERDESFNKFIKVRYYYSSLLGFEISRYYIFSSDIYIISIYNIFAEESAKFLDISIFSFFLMKTTLYPCLDSGFPPLL